MNGFIASGHVVDLLLAVILAEFMGLMWLRRARGIRAVAVELLFTLAPGVCLLMALRSALTGAPWIWIAAWLAASFPFHLGDLLRRRP